MVRFDIKAYGLDAVIDDIALLASSLETKMDEFTQKVADKCCQQATVYWSFVSLQDVNGAPLPLLFDGLSVEKCENGYAVTASGQSVCFVEFGAGVYYNGSESYPGVRPEGIVGIGQYGKGHGMKEKWKFRGGVTHGNPAFFPMFQAANDVELLIEEVAKEVFGADG